MLYLLSDKISKASEFEVSQTITIKQIWGYRLSYILWRTPNITYAIWNMKAERNYAGSV